MKGIIVNKGNIEEVRKQIADELKVSEEEIAGVINEIIIFKRRFTDLIKELISREVLSQEKQELKAQAIFAALLTEAIITGKALAMSHNIDIEEQKQTMIDFINKYFDATTDDDLRIIEKYNKLFPLDKK